MRRNTRTISCASCGRAASRPRSRLPPATAVRWLDEQGQILGRPSCIVDRVAGESPPASLFTEGVLRDATPEDRHRMMLSVAEAHGRLRRAALGPGVVAHLTERGAGHGATAIEREYAWWLEEARLADPSPDKLALLTEARDFMVAHQPDGLYPENLCHGDAQFANNLFQGGQLVAMLDWELAYLGHNEADLALLIIFSDTLNPEDDPVEGVPTTPEYIAAYETAAGSPAHALPYFTAFCLMKVATAMVFGAETMPGAEDLWRYYSGRYIDAISRL